MPDNVCQMPTSRWSSNNKSFDWIGPKFGSMLCSPLDNVPAVVWGGRALMFGSKSIINVNTAGTKFFDKSAAVALFVCKATDAQATSMNYYDQRAWLRRFGWT